MKKLLLLFITSFAFSEFTEPNTGWSYVMSTNQAFYILVSPLDIMTEEGEHILGYGDGSAGFSPDSECTTNPESCDVLGTFISRDIDDLSCSDAGGYFVNGKCDVCVGWSYYNSYAESGNGSITTTMMLGGYNNGVDYTYYLQNGEIPYLKFYDASEDITYNLINNYDLGPFNNNDIYLYASDCSQIPEFEECQEFQFTATENPIISGCTNPYAINFDENAVVNDGSCIENSFINVPFDFPSIQEALNNAIEGDTILVAPGTYYENIEWPNTNGIKLIGSGRDESFIDGNASGRVINFSGEGFWDIDSSTTIESLTIQNGYLPGWDSGAGLQTFESDIKIIDVNIYNNHCENGNGGGINTGNAAPYLENVNIINNSAGYGGGILSGGNGLVLKNVLIQGNSSNASCAGIYLAYSTAIMDNVIIEENEANDYGGGGCFEYDTNVSSTDLIIRNNIASSAGALNLFRCYYGLNLNNLLVYGNIAYDNGGAFYIHENSVVTFNNLTIADNLVDDFGATAYLENNSSLTIKNSILNNENGNEIVFNPSNWPNSLNIDHSNIVGGSNSLVSSDNGGVNFLDGNIDENSQFTDPENGDFTLQPNSPCINAGDPNSDLDPDGTVADIGAIPFDHREWACTDPEACNYDPEALYDDGSCVYGDNCYGCTNPDAMNYEEDAVFDDGSCVLPDIIVPDDYSSIQEALINASESNTIFVRPGIYYEYSIEWPLLPNIKLIGAGREITIIDAQNNDRAFIIDGNNNPVINHNSIIEGFTIKNGYNINAGLPGGALTINFAQPTLRNLIIEDSEGYTGGAVWIRGDAGSVLDTLIIDDVIFKNNNAIHGGGLAIAPMQYLGEVESRPYISIKNSHFINNSSNGSTLGGGGIFVHIRSANLNIDNSSFIGNTSSNDGGAILLDEAHLSQEIIISNSIIIDNIANGGNTIDGLGYSIISNSIIYGNTPIVSYGSININSIIEGAYIDDNNFYNCFNSDPLFIDYNNGNYLLSPNSPCIDSGTDYVEYNGEVIYQLSPDEYEGFAPDIGPWETSQMFVPDPIITNIEDLDNDQGGNVYLEFQRSFHDKDGLSRIEAYQVERLDDGDWIGVGSYNAYADSFYTIQVPTIIDSSSTSDGLTDFRVIANMEEGNFLSETSTGYSVDNIHPSVPENMFASSSEQDVNLSWDYTEDIDFAHHMVSDIDDNPAYTIGNDIIIPLNTRYNEYHVNSLDINGNMSDNSEYASAYDLSQGANLISFSILPEDRSVGNVIQSDDITAIIGEGVAASYNPVLGWVGSLSEISSAQGYWVASSNGEILNTVGQRIVNTEYDLHPGANLISYTCDQSAPVEDIVQDIEITSVIGEGLATTYNPVLGWVGSLSSLEPGSGYWFQADSNVDFSFDCPESETFSREYVEAPIKDYIQSTEQAFYFFGNIPEAEEGDVIRAYNSDILVGSRVWSGSYTDVPVMGKDFQSETQGFLTDSQVPTFKLIKKSGQELMLQADIPEWTSNGIFIIENASSSEIIPDNFGLASAYPNPFNPTTTISFSVPSESIVSLKIYDISGRLLKTLLSNNYQPGYHSVTWNASDISSGVYFVKMNADGFSTSQKLMLIK